MRLLTGFLCVCRLDWQICIGFYLDGFETHGGRLVWAGAVYGLVEIEAGMREVLEVRLMFCS